MGNPSPLHVQTAAPGRAEGPGAPGAPLLHDPGLLKGAARGQASGLSTKEILRDPAGKWDSTILMATEINTCMYIYIYVYLFI